MNLQVTWAALPFAALLHVGLFFWQRKLSRAESLRHDVSVSTPVFLALIAAYEFAWGSAPWLYGLAGLFLAGRVIQAAGADTRRSPALLRSGAALSWATIGILILLPMRGAF